MPGAVPVFSQTSSDTTGQRRIELDEFVLNRKERKHHAQQARPAIPWSTCFSPSSSVQHFRATDSSFSLTPIAPLSTGPVRLLEITLKLRAWDTSRMRLNFMVLQIHGGDTSYTIFPIPMQVKRNRLRLQFPGNGLVMQADTIYLGYSVAAFYVPEYFCYRMYANHDGVAANAYVHSGALKMNLENAYHYAIPFDLVYEDI